MLCDWTQSLGRVALWVTLCKVKISLLITSGKVTQRPSFLYTGLAFSNWGTRNSILWDVKIHPEYSSQSLSLRNLHCSLRNYQSGAGQREGAGAGKCCRLLCRGAWVDDSIWAFTCVVWFPQILCNQVNTQTNQWMILISSVQFFFLGGDVFMRFFACGTSMWVCGCAHLGTCTRRPEDDHCTFCLSLAPYHLSINQKLTILANLDGHWMLKIGLLLPPPLGLQAHGVLPSILHRCCYSNSAGPWACTASALPSEPSTEPQFRGFLK